MATRTPTTASGGSAPASSSKSRAGTIPPPRQPTGDAPSKPGSGPASDAAIGFGRRGRVYLAGRQRGADVTTVGQLLLYLPIFGVSLVIVVAISCAVLPGAPWVPVAGWLATGALAFHRPAEGVFARRLLHLRHPTPKELTRLEAVWREVTARAGVEGRAYELWIEDNHHLNAYAAAGHIVGVTRCSLEILPNEHLAAVLAHELGHHVGGHAWSSLLGEWYAVPGRLAWAAVRRLASLVPGAVRRLNGFVALVLFLMGSGLVLTLAVSYWFVPAALVVAPYLLAAVGRRAELRADRHAAALGFGSSLAEVLHRMHTAGSAAGHTAALSGCGQADAVGAAARSRRDRPGLLGSLLSSHPDYHTRLHHLAPYLGRQR